MYGASHSPSVLVIYPSFLPRGHTCGVTSGYNSGADITFVGDSLIGGHEDAGEAITFSFVQFMGENKGDVPEYKAHFTKATNKQMHAFEWCSERHFPALILQGA